MKIINQSETKDERWYVGDVLEYSDHTRDEAKHAMIIRIIDPVVKGWEVKDKSVFNKYSTVRLDGGFDGDVGAFYQRKWLTSYIYDNVESLKKEFLKACIYVKKVPFYGVIGKPEED